MAPLTDFPAHGSAFSAIPQTKKLAARKGHKAVQLDTARLRSMVFSHSELLYLSSAGHPKEALLKRYNKLACVCQISQTMFVSTLCPRL
jgi:hypothetical protein